MFNFGIYSRRNHKIKKDTSEITNSVENTTNLINILKDINISSKI